MRQLSIALGAFGNPAPPAPTSKHALRLCQRLFYPSVGQLDLRFADDRPECLFFNQYDFDSRL